MKRATSGDVCRMGSSCGMIEVQVSAAEAFSRLSPPVACHAVARIHVGP